MQLTDQELWHILQVEPAAKPRPWERDDKPVPGTAWIEWAKTEILSGVGVASKSGIHLERCCVYLARLVRVLDVLVECGIAQTSRRREDGAAIYEESFLNALLLNGLEACGYSSGKIEDTFWLATRDGVLTGDDFDDWCPGMASGSGWRKYYGLTFKGKKQAANASVMPQVEETGRDERAQIDAACRAGCAPPNDSMQSDTHNFVKGDVRSFAIWQGRLDHKGEVELAYGGCEGTQTEFKGIYYEDYEVGAPGKKAVRHPAEFRIGHIYDSVKARVLVFRQLVTSRNDAFPNAVVIGENEYHNTGIIDVWSDDDVPCRVEDYNVREPTAEDLKRVACIRQKEPSHREERIPDQQNTAYKAITSQPLNKPPTMEETAILDLCGAMPNQAFLYWLSFEEDLARCPSLGRDEERKFRAMRDTFREWFEDLGHWRDLRPKSKDLDPDDHNAHAKHQKQIEDYMAERQARVHRIDYDEVRKAHKCQHEGTEHEDVEYNWEYFRDGISQLIVRTAGGNVHPPHRDPVKRQYFKNTPPKGYAILECGNKLLGAVFFPNGEHYDFDPCFGDENRFYPDEFFKAGDYELRRVGKKNATLDALHADVREIKQIAIPLPGAIANVEKGIESMMPHVRGIPSVLADLNEARLVPEEATRELFSQIQDVLTIEDQRIWTAVRNAGTQKGAIELLREADLIMSEATLSRRVRDIDEKLLKKGLPPCKASGPRIRFTKSGGHPDADGKAMPEDLSPVERDWANDPAERDITIQAYLNANPGDKEFFRQTKPGIEEEAQKHRKRRPMKSG